MTKRVVFIANEAYLSLPWLEELPLALHGIAFHLIDPDRLNLASPINQEEECLKNFETVVFNESFSNEQFRQKELWIKESLELINPDLVFTFTSSNYTYRCIRKYFPKLMVYVQQVGYFKKDLERTSWALRTKARLYNQIKGSPILSTAKYLWSFNSSTVYGVWSEEFVPKGIRPKVNFQVIGNRQLDQSLEYYRNSDKNVKGQNSKRFIYLTQPLGKYFEPNVVSDCLKLIGEVLSTDETITLGLKLHPRDDVSVYEALYTDFSSRVYLIQESKIENALLEHDVALVHYSAAIDNAVAMNIQVLSIDPHSVFTRKLPIESNFVKTITCIEDYLSVQTYLNDEESRLKAREEHLSKVTGFQDGNTVTRITSLLKLLLK